MTIFVTVLHVLVCLILIVVVLLQRGKGAEIGAVFGGGGGSTLFGSRGAGTFLTRLTSGAAIIFMFTSLTLAYFAQDDTRSTLFEGQEEVQQEASPFEEAGAPTPAEEASAFEEVEAPVETGEETSPFQEVAPPDAEAPASAGSDVGEAPPAPAGDAPEPPALPGD